MQVKDLEPSKFIVLTCFCGVQYCFKIMESHMIQFLDFEPVTVTLHYCFSSAFVVCKTCPDMCCMFMLHVACEFMQLCFDRPSDNSVCVCVCVSTKHICGPLCMMGCRMMTNGMRADYSYAKVKHFKLVSSGYTLYDIPTGRHLLLETYIVMTKQLLASYVHCPLVAHNQLVICE